MSTGPHPDHVAADETDTTLLGMKPRDSVIVVGALVVLGVGLGLALPAIAQWARETDWVPLPGLVRGLDAIASELGRWILPVAGAVAGTLFGLAIVSDETKLQVTSRDVTFIKGDRKQRFSRAQVTVAVLDGKYLVLRDERDADLVREKLGMPSDEILEALRRHGWSVVR